MKNLCLLILLVLSASGLSAQQIRRTPTLGFGLQAVQPVGQYANLYDGYPVGLSGQFAIPAGRAPFDFGAAFSWNSMGSQNEDVSVFAGQDESGDDIYTPGTMRIRSNNYRYLALARFRPFAGGFQIYADALGGIETFSTKTDLQLDNQGYSEVRDSEVQERDITLNFGWAAGVRIRVAQGTFIEARLEKLEGGLADYVDPNSIEVNHDDNSLNYEMRQSQTDKFTYQLGVAFQF
jgi:hypothetical protein